MLEPLGAQLLQTLAGNGSEVARQLERLTEPVVEPSQFRLLDKLIKLRSPIQLFLAQLELGGHRSTRRADALSSDVRPVGKQFKLNNEMMDHMLVGGREVELRVEPRKIATSISMLLSLRQYLKDSRYQL